MNTSEARGVACHPTASADEATGGSSSQQLCDCVGTMVNCSHRDLVQVRCNAPASRGSTLASWHSSSRTSRVSPRPRSWGLPQAPWVGMVAAAAAAAAAAAGDAAASYRLAGWLAGLLRCHWWAGPIRPSSTSAATRGFASWTLAWSPTCPRCRRSTCAAPAWSSSRQT